jgi:hypothetical protein
MTKRHPGKKRAIKETFSRLGLQSRPAEVVASLAACGVEVSEGMVRAVAWELLREAARAERQRIKARKPVVVAPGKRVNKVPPRRGKRFR